MKVKYLDLPKDHQNIKSELISAISNVLDSAQFINGEETQKFEKNVCDLLGVKYAVGVNSGTDALFLTMKALGIGKGDEVIVPANSFLASATTVAQTGAKPVFCDVKDNYLIDENNLENLVTKDTKAIMPVHLTGKPCNMDKIMSIADKYNLHVIEDCAQAILAKWDNQYAGTFGTGCFSLHPLKNLSACGDAGLITTNDANLYESLLPLRNIGLKNRNEADILGYNSRLDSLQAAILNVKLKYLEQTTEKRRQNADLYHNILTEKNFSGVKYIPFDEDKEHSVYHTFIIQTEKRDELQKYLTENGVDSLIHYPLPIHKQKCFEYLNPPCLPKVEEQSKSILTLPVNQNLTADQIRYVCDKIEDFYDR